MIDVARPPQALVAGSVLLYPNYDVEDPLYMHKVALWRATALAVESAFRFGVDLPVGASVISSCNGIYGAYASDKRTGVDSLHAERYALDIVKLVGVKPSMLGVTIEPCVPCQGAIEQSGVEGCSYVLSREQVSNLGLVNKRTGIKPETSPMFSHVANDDTLTAINLALLGSTDRDTTTGVVVVDTQKLLSELLEFDQVQPIAIV